MRADLDLGYDPVPSGARLAERLAHGAAWRRSPAAGGGPAGHAEWAHFQVVGDEVALVASLSLLDAVHAAGAAAEVPRVTLLARTADGWTGDVDAFAPGTADLDAEGTELRVGASRLAFRDGAWHLDLRLAAAPLAARLVLRPTARPARIEATFGSTAGLRGFVVPRLAAAGEIEAGGRRFALRDAPAWHGHEWGAFRWGVDAIREWAFAFEPAGAGGAERAWSVAFDRVGDRGRLRTEAQRVALWRGARHVRTLHEDAVRIADGGRLPAAGALRVPRAMALVAPGRAADLPRRLEIRAAEDGDVVEASFALADVAQIAIPDAAPARAPTPARSAVTIVNQCHARARVAGRVGGEPLRFETDALVELVRGGA